MRTDDEVSFPVRPRTCSRWWPSGAAVEELPYAAEHAEVGATIAHTRHTAGDRPPGPPTGAELAPLLVGPEAVRVERFGVTG